jgi:hypothetical protein
LEYVVYPGVEIPEVRPALVTGAAFPRLAILAPTKGIDVVALNVGVGSHVFHPMGIS